MAKAEFINKVAELPTFEIGSLVLYKTPKKNEEFVVLVTSLIGTEYFNGVVVAGNGRIGFYCESWARDKFVLCTLGSQVILTQ